MEKIELGSNPSPAATRARGYDLVFSFSLSGAYLVGGEGGVVF